MRLVGNIGGLGASILGGVACLLMCVSALGQYSAIQINSIAINAPTTPGLASPYPSKIDLTGSNILGVVEHVDVTVGDDITL